MADVKKCDNCERVQRDEEDPQYDWWIVGDGLGVSMISAELCSKECIDEWVDWQINQRKEIEAKVAEEVGVADE